MVVLLICITYPFVLAAQQAKQIVSASLKKEHISDASSNVTVVTREMIENRGYQNLVEVCEDLPGFDFLIYEDGGGEYPTYNMNRGMGNIGNAKMLVMIDGIIQNNISFNWTLLWTDEGILHDLDRIEIIEGPGSAIYGAQAYSGVIHLITQSKINKTAIKPFYGSNNTRGVDGLWGYKFSKDAHLTIAFRRYLTDGDSGDRYDPGNYFHNLRFPMTVLKEYDANGNFVTNTSHPQGGQPIPDGFQNWQNHHSFRFKLQLKNTEIGGFFWDNYRGSGSYLTGYEYFASDREHQAHSRGYHAYVKNNYQFSNKFSLESNVVYRATHIMPRTGFSYLWRFPGMIKNYVAFSYQGYIEERLSYSLSDKTDFLLGVKAMNSAKSPRVVSLNYFPQDSTHTESSWEIADAGGGLGVPETFQTINVRELAVYGLWKNTWSKAISTSVGLRFDKSSEYGQIFNPRLALILKPTKNIGIKALIGTAFRQPSIFELTSEFRGNPNLEPEKITTYELELNSRITKKLNLRTNVFYSVLRDFIGKTPDPTKPAGERYENLTKSWVSGLSFILDFQLTPDIRFFSNYMFLQGKNEAEDSWSQIERTARHKVNAGVNVALFNRKLNINFRANCVGKRKAQAANAWLQKYEGGYAPGYIKAHLVLTYKGLSHIKPQLIIKNIFDKQYYGVARETGSGMIDDYDYIDNPNPPGFIPSYHSQPGRTIMFNIKFEF